VTPAKASVSRTLDFEMPIREQPPTVENINSKYAVISESCPENSNSELQLRIKPFPTSAMKKAAGAVAEVVGN
jgi:hypothetical protein